MSKIFLSHSSTDKDFVRPIFDKFGADRCYYDEYTFEIGMQTMREIIKSLNKTDIFVVFISEAALKSNWVKDELKIAIDDFMNHKHMLRQIFPIIIDQNISYNDERIPLYLREGDNAHNIRHVITSELAYHKIKNQLSRLELEKDNNRYLRCNLFYGRDKEKGVFKEEFDAWDKNGNPKNIKCMIIAGIEGIGRKSYAKEVLKEAGIIENYYYPMILEMSNNDSIDDLLSKLNFDLGLGEYTRKQLNSGLDVEDKIKILIELFETAHKYREIIVIEDNSCLLKAKEIQWWFKKALSQMANRIAVVIVSQNKLDKYKCKKDKELFYIELDNLPLNVACGLLRVLSKNQEIPFSDEDIYSFRDVITGYPPQIIRCVEIAKAEESIDIAKEQKEEIRRVANNASAKMLNLIIDEKNREDVQSFLAFFAKLGVVPATFMNEIAKKNEVYKSVFERINEFAICTRSGSDDSYKLNAVIRDYIQRTGYTVGPELKIELEKIVTNFMQNINKDDYINNLTYAEFTYAIVEMLKKNKNIPDEYLYGSIFLKAIIESYNNHKYRKVIELGKLAKESLAFRKSTEEVKDLIIFYYCSALAREKDDEFLNIVKYFQEDRNNAAHYQKYNFLRGFEERIKGQYDRAEEHFLNVSYKDINFSRVRRELVIVYSNLGKYDEAFNLAKENYEHNCENWYHIQGYFDCIVHSNNWKNNSDVIDKIMTDIEDLNMLKENIIYYQIKANYYAYIRHDIGQAFEIINQGKRSFRDNFYLFRDSFDIAVHFKNKQYMQNAYDELNKLYGNENDKKYALKTRKVYLDAMNGMSEINIKKAINNIGGMSEQAKERLFNKVVVWKQSY